MTRIWRGYPTWATRAAIPPARRWWEWRITQWWYWRQYKRDNRKAFRQECDNIRWHATWTGPGGKMRP